MANIDKYFDVDKKKSSLLPSHRILRLTENNVDVLNRPDSDLEDVELSQNLKTREYEVNTNYKVNEVSRNRAEEIIREQEKEWSLWEEYMSSPEDRSSDHLTKDGERLY